MQEGIRKLGYGQRSLLPRKVDGLSPENVALKNEGIFQDILCSRKKYIYIYIYVCVSRP